VADPVTTIPLTGPINLLAKVGNGSVTVIARDDLAEATVRLTPRDPNSDILSKFTVRMDGPTLTVIGPRQGGLTDLIIAWQRDKNAVDAEIEVPTRTAAKVTTASADIIIQGTVGGADIATGSAQIEIDAVDGDLRLRYGSANSSVRAVSGSAVVRSGSGDARFGEIGGDLQAGFGSGDLAAEVVHGGVRSRTGSGDAHIGAVYGDVDLASGSGGLSIGLPAGLSARLDVTTGSGRVQSELPIEDNVSPGGKAITVRARTGSGDVRLFRAA
jgi:hypothetical protein